jgi:TonB family protein
MNNQITRRLILVLAVAVLCSTWISAPATVAGSRYNFPSREALADWQRYKVKGEEFSVSLPTLPSMFRQVTYLSKLDKYRDESVMSAYFDGVVFVVHAFDNPKRRQSLDEIMAEFNRPASEVTREVTVGGFNGREYSFQSANTVGVTQFYITDKHVYVFKAAGSTLGDAEAATSKFISSVRLEKQPDGLDVAEEAGGQWGLGPSKPVEDAGKVMSGKNVTNKALIVMKPEPRYTEAARLNRVTGTVVLRAVFSESGTVKSIRAVSGLPNGLTEQAIVAARRIKFIPAIKDGHFVSMYFQLEYNFNLY